MDAHLLFNSMLNEVPLYLLEPRYGCIARGHVIGDWMKGKKLVVGRMWALSTSTDRKMISGEPVWLPESDICQSNFKAPLLSPSMEPLKGVVLSSDQESGRPLEIEEDGQTGLLWSAHVAAFAHDINNEPIIYDPALFDGPVRGAVWRGLFDAKEVIFTQTRWTSAPLYGHFGASHEPAVQNEHEPPVTPMMRNYIRSMEALGTAIAYRPHKAPITPIQLKVLVA